MADADGSGRESVTIRDVAAAADVHISTVSRALDPKKSSLVSRATRAKVLAVADELGYRPHLIASGLRRGRTHTLGIVLPDIGNPLYAPLTRGVAHVLDRGGYMPLVADTLDDHERLGRILRHLLGRRVDAIIVAAARTADRKVLVDTAASGVPVILAVRTLAASRLPSVSHDDAEGGRLAARHLLALGHARLGQVLGPDDVEPFRGRSRGFEEEVRRAGAKLVEPPERARQPTMAEGRRITELLLRSADAPPTGIFAQNDLLALGALDALREWGLRCPEEVSVIGYNDAFFAEHARPALTTVRLSGYEVGRLVGNMAIECIENPETEPATLSVAPSLVVRDSTAAPPGAEG